MYYGYLHSRSVNDRRHSLKLTLKFRYGTFSVKPILTLTNSTGILENFVLFLINFGFGLITYHTVFTYTGFRLVPPSSELD